MRQLESISIRPISAEETPLLEEFTYWAIHIPQGETPPERSILKEPFLRALFEGFGSGAYDRAVVAHDGHEIIGIAWVRICHSYGSVAPDIPELAISVLPDQRGRGVGMCLMQALLRLIDEDGVEKISLSVQKDNRAVRLYERCGFTVLKEQETDFIMVRSHPSARA
ncbi:MAG: GNAT family N-acetyltransferase [Actinomycetaceae bacterium]|nr:GNAT family N-acetyltransferase [Actinomycetaceae bacterium]